MSEEEIVEAAALMLEDTLLQAQEEEEVSAMIIGKMGARIMGWLEDGEELLGEDEDSWWESVAVDVEAIRNMGDPCFAMHFRVSKSTFEVLLETLANFMIDSGKVIRVRNRLDLPLLQTLWILANPDTFRSVALQFGVRPGSVHRNYSEIILCLRQMAGLYIKWPDATERREIADCFEAYSGFPGIVGVIDGSHSVITAPHEQKDRYRNRHHTYSYNVMAVCDHNLLIRDLHAGEVGSLHDARVFRRNPLYRKLIEDEDGELLEHDQHIIGDKAYTLMDCVMVLFRNRGNLTEQQRAFNYALCKCRARIEHAFGKAFGQWRRMKAFQSANTDIAVDHIVSCFVVHNFMILNGEKLVDLDDPTFLYEDYVELDEDDEDNEDNEEAEDDGRDDIRQFNRLVTAQQLRGTEKRIELVNRF